MRSRFGQQISVAFFFCEVYSICDAYGIVANLDRTPASFEERATRSEREGECSCLCTVLAADQVSIS